MSTHPPFDIVHPHHGPQPSATDTGCTRERDRWRCAWTLVELNTLKAALARAGQREPRWVTKRYSIELSKAWRVRAGIRGGTVGNVSLEQIEAELNGEPRTLEPLGGRHAA